MTELKGKKSKKNLEFIALDQTKQDAFTKNMKKLKKKKKALDDFDSNEPGVIFIKHLPHGFFEPQLRRYFEQFGTVTRLRLSRSKKTGRSKCYAYIEFECKAVAKVAAETMNNYLLFEHILKCEVIPQDKLHPETFKGSDRVFYKPATRKIAINKYNKPKMEPKNILQRETRKKKTLNKLKSKLEELGVDYDITNLGVKEGWKPPARKLPDENNKNQETPSGNKEEISKPLDVSTEMIVDLDDQEIQFKTPPKSAKVKKRSLHLSGRDEPTNQESTCNSPVVDNDDAVSTNKKKAAEESTNQIEAGGETTNQNADAPATPKLRRKREVSSKTCKKSSKKSILSKKRALLNKTL